MNAEPSPNAPSVADAYLPPAFSYSIATDTEALFFDGEGVGVIDIVLSVGLGAPTEFHSGEAEQLTVGARLFANVGTAEEPEPGAQIGEYRVESGAFTAQKGAHYDRPLVVRLPQDAPDRLLLGIELIKEGHFWFSALGHPVHYLPIERRHAFVPSFRDTPAELQRTARNQRLLAARETRYEAIIFALLNRLDRRRDG